MSVKVPLFPKKKDGGNFAGSMALSEAADIVQMKSNQRIPIQEIIKEFNDCIDRIERTCPDDGPDYQESQESSSGSSSDVICC